MSICSNRIGHLHGKWSADQIKHNSDQKKSEAPPLLPIYASKGKLQREPYGKQVLETNYSVHRKQTITCKGPSMDQGILEWSNELFTENHMKLIQKLGSGWVEIHEGKILLTFSFEGPKHVMFGRARGAATHQQVKIESTRIEKTTSADTVPLSPHHTHAHTNL